MSTSNMFEHLTFYDGERYLEACMKILAPGGELHMSLPNMDFHVYQWVNNISMEHAKAGFFGWQRESEIGETWDVHKSGYNFAQLRAVVESKGFKDVHSLRKPSNKHLEITALKP